MLGTRVLCTALVASLSPACASTPAATCPANPAAAASGAAAIPAFPMEALKSPHARSLKLYLSPDGSYSKVSVYVERAGIPDWAHALADQELGKGEEVEFEVEQYRGGDTTYEITRLVDGKKLELSVRSTDRQVLYRERKELPLDQVPAEVRKAAGAIKGFTAQKYGVKESRGQAPEHELEGTLDGHPCSIHFAPDGAIRSRSVEVPSRVKLAR